MVPPAMRDLAGCFWLTLIAWVPVVAWCNHVLTCFQEEMWGFLIAGALFFPIGILHGMWLWFQ